MAGIAKKLLVINPGKPISKDYKAVIASLKKEKVQVCLFPRGAVLVLTLIGIQELQKGIHALNITTDESKGLRIASPPLIAKWGVSSSYQGKAQKPTMQVDIPSTPEYDGFRELLTMVGDKIVEIAQESASEFVADKAKRSPDRVKEDFAPIIKTNEKTDSKTGKVLNTYDPSVRFKLNLVKDCPESRYDEVTAWQIVVEDADGAKISPEKLKNKNNQIMVLFDVRGAMHTKTGNSFQLIASRIRILAENTSGEDAAGDDAWGGDDNEAIKSAKKARTDAGAASSGGFPEGGDE